MNLWNSSSSVGTAVVGSSVVDVVEVEEVVEEVVVEEEVVDELVESVEVSSAGNDASKLAKRFIKKQGSGAGLALPILAAMANMTRVATRICKNKRG